MHSSLQVAGTDAELFAAVFTRISLRLEALLERSVSLRPDWTARRSHRVAGEGGNHLAFRLTVHEQGRTRDGCLLVPYAEAATLAGYHAMLPEESVCHHRLLDAPDEALKETLRELNRFVAGAVDKTLAEFTYGRQRAESGTPQGVRSGVRPAFSFEEGAELVVGIAEGRIDTFPAFDLILMLPPPEGFDSVLGEEEHGSVQADVASDQV